MENIFRGVAKKHKFVPVIKQQHALAMVRMKQREGLRP